MYLGSDKAQNTKYRTCIRNDFGKFGVVNAGED